MFSAIIGSICGASRWKKASKCKRLIKELKIRLRNEKRRKCAIVRQSCADIAQLLHYGHRDLALARVEKFHKDRCRLSAYDQFDVFCDCIHNNLREIARANKLSNEVIEAVSSLIFGASRCGELLELNSLRNLFKQHFGLKFERTNVELLPGNSVDSRLTDNLNAASLTQDIKMKLLQEIHKDDYTIHPDTKQTENPNHQSHDDRRAIYDGRVDFETPDQIQASKFEEVVKKMGKSIFAFANYGQDQDFCRDEKRISKSPSSHVHPKLPDYDKLARTFTNSKKNHIEMNSKFQGYWSRHIVHTLF